ncbi:GDSL-type esterase/lipase family protein [Chitinophaga sp. XS-30]|uniref:GDSL-type esterase/lipase family protein n=1 Tax=Chitinophaga sp. XS-30 TaxID=2604421 RepID=UPI0011DCCFAB|nr:GDSL-type esterase/lipase family protein [Chitinophaga sp. XS-30]QEH41327.1 GDSL family lipase [Chitinophaga sp. XS-30]
MKFSCKYASLGWILGIVTFTGASAQTVDSTYDNSHYRERQELFATLPKQKKAIVFLGNSITEAGKWNEILPGKPVQNRGISGDNTFGVLARLPDIVAARPAKLFLLIGVNDLKREVPVTVIIDNYRKMVQMVKEGSPKTKLYLQSVLPVNDTILIEPFRKVTNANVAKLNEALQQLAKDNNCRFVNLHEPFADAQGQLKRKDTPDGLHLKVGAYAIWVNYLRSKKYL